MKKPSIRPDRASLEVNYGETFSIVPTPDEGGDGRATNDPKTGRRSSKHARRHRHYVGPHRKALEVGRMRALTTK